MRDLLSFGDDSTKSDAVFRIRCIGGLVTGADHQRLMNGCQKLRKTGKRKEKG